MQAILAAGALRCVGGRVRSSCELCLVSYDAGDPPFGDYGRIRASILVVTVVLRPDAGGSLAGTLQIACNVGFAGLMTGEPEGFKLSVPGFNFDTPIAGLTHISIPEGASSA